MRVAIVGAGLQCMRRAEAVKDCSDAELVTIASRNTVISEKLSSKFGCEPEKDWISAVNRDDIDAVIVCTPPNLHAEISITAMRAGKHVLCEKPLSRTLKEAEDMVRTAKETGKILKCGFNHRHHPAIFIAKQMVDKGSLGKPLFARCRYGNCGRPEYEKEWRADPKQAAGGQFIEQGIHAIDLFRWFLGELAEVCCMTSNHFFKKMPLEDDGMAIFRAKSGATATLHTTLAQWKNLFSFEVFCEEGYAIIDGLGGSYGEEKLTVGKRDFNSPFQDKITYFRRADQSWREELKEFIESIKEGREPIGNGKDGLESMRVALTAYKSEKEGRILRINHNK